MENTEVLKEFSKNILSSQKTLYIGDETRDIEAAHKAGIKILAACWGFQDKSILQSLEPWGLLNKPDDIISALNQ